MSWQRNGFNAVAISMLSTVEAVDSRQQINITVPRVNAEGMDYCKQ